MTGGKKRRRLVLLLMMLICVVGMGMSAHAELESPRLTRAKAGLSKVTLKWQSVPAAKGYYVYTVKKDGSLKQRAKVKGAGKTTITITRLKNNVTFSFCVAAYRGAEVSEPSNIRKATPSVGNPGKVKQARVKSISNKRVYLAWDTNPKADGYQIMMLNESTGAYEQIKAVPRDVGNCMISNLKNGTTYYFKIRAFLKKGRAYGYGPMTATLVGRPLSYSTLRKTSQVHPYYYKAKMNYAVTVDGVKIPAGKTVTVTDLGTSTSKITYDSKTLKIPTASFTPESFVVKPSAAYSPEVAENFVNIRGYQSPTDYLVWINTYTQQLYVFRGSQYNWKYVKHTPCCTGKIEKPTRLGVWQLYAGSKKPVVFFTTVSGKAIQGGFWGIRTGGGGYIHSWLYNITDIVDFDWEEERIRALTVPESSLPTTLAQGKHMQWNGENFSYPSSSGCMRVTIAFAKWLYDNVPESTTNVIY